MSVINPLLAKLPIIAKSLGKNGEEAAIRMLKDGNRYIVRFENLTNGNCLSYNVASEIGLENLRSRFGTVFDASVNKNEIIEALQKNGFERLI